MLSYLGCCFYFSIVDNYSQYIWIFPIQAKSNVSSTFLAFLWYVSNTFSTNVVSMQSGWGGEFQPLHSLCNPCE